MFVRRLLKWGRLFVDLWYAAEDANARPPSLVGAVEVRWRGSVVGSQETKRRLFSEKTSAVEWVRAGYVVSRSVGKTVPIVLLNPMQLFQDHSMAWYRVMWKVCMRLYPGFRVVFMTASRRIIPLVHCKGRRGGGRNLHHGKVSERNLPPKLFLIAH